MHKEGLELSHIFIVIIIFFMDVALALGLDWKNCKLFCFALGVIITKTFSGHHQNLQDEQEANWPMVSNSVQAG